MTNYRIIKGTATDVESQLNHLQHSNQVNVLKMCTDNDNEIVILMEVQSHGGVKWQFLPTGTGGVGLNA